MRDVQLLQHRWLTLCAPIGLQASQSGLLVRFHVRTIRSYQAQVRNQEGSCFDCHSRTCTKQSCCPASWLA